MGIYLPIVPEEANAVQVTQVDGVLSEELVTFLDTLPTGWNKVSESQVEVFDETGAFLPAGVLGMWVVFYLGRVEVLTSAEFTSLYV